MEHEITEDEARWLIEADSERVRWAWYFALKESGPYPGDDAPFQDIRKWVRSVNRLARKIGSRLN